MNSHEPETIVTRQAGNRVLLGTVAVGLLTTVHHVYGAVVYDTPWRHHAAIVAGLATGLIAGALYLSQKPSGGAIATIGRWAFISITLAVPILSFGVFEGAYNHCVKDALYFGGASADLMRRLFPPPTYELPNDVFFEITGVMQVLPAAFTAFALYRFVRERTGKVRRSAEIIAKAA